MRSHCSAGGYLPLYVLCPAAPAIERDLCLQVSSLLQVSLYVSPTMESAGCDKLMWSWHVSYGTVNGVSRPRSTLVWLFVTATDT